MMTKLSNEHAVAAFAHLQSLRNAQSEAVAWRYSADGVNWSVCSSRDQAKYHPFFEPLYTHPAPPLAVTDEMVRSGARGIWDAGEVGVPFEMAPKAVTDSLFKQSRAALTAALEAKQ